MIICIGSEATDGSHIILNLSGNILISITQGSPIFKSNIFQSIFSQEIPLNTLKCKFVINLISQNIQFPTCRIQKLRED